MFDDYKRSVGSKTKGIDLQKQITNITMSNKAKAILYGLALVAAMALAITNWNTGNTEAAIAWFCAGGMAGAASVANAELNNKD